MLSHLDTFAAEVIVLVSGLMAKVKKSPPLVGETFSHSFGCLGSESQHSPPPACTFYED